MATRTHKLATTDLQIRNAKPEDKKLIFGNGLTVVITKTGRKTLYLFLPEGLSHAEVLLNDLRQKKHVGSVKILRCAPIKLSPLLPLLPIMIQ